MATSTARRTRLSEDQLKEVLGLIRGSDSVELKLTVSESDQRSAVQSLDMDPLEAQIRQVFFLDTPDLALNRGGLVVRARRVQGRQADTVVKLRPVVPDELPAELRASPNMKVEVDAMPGGFVCSASLKGKSENPAVREVAAGTRSVGSLFSKEQRSFFKAHTPDNLTLDDLSVLGPINLLKLKMAPRGFGRKLVAELWLYPNGSRLLELSTVCAPTEAFEVAIETRAFLESKGIDLTGEQQTKTKTALDYFSRLQRADARGDG